METLAYTYAHAYALRIACVRLGDVFGSTRDHSDKVLPRFAKLILDQRPVELLDETIAFDFIHIDDVVERLQSAIKRLDAASGATFIGLRYSSGRRWTLRELAGALGVCLGAIGEASEIGTGAKGAALPCCSANIVWRRFEGKRRGYSFT